MTQKDLERLFSSDMLNRPAELILIIVIVVLFGTFGFLSFTGLSETHDATLVQTVQADLQGTISHASGNQGVGAHDLVAANVINAVRQEIPPAVKLRPTGLVDSPYELIFENTGRRAIFTVTLNGDVRIKFLLGQWTRFHQVNGFIEKN